MDVIKCNLSIYYRRKSAEIEIWQTSIVASEASEVGSEKYFASQPGELLTGWVFWALFYYLQPCGNTLAAPDIYPVKEYAETGGYIVP